MRPHIAFLFILFSQLSFSQDCAIPNANKFLHGNQIRANISNTGSLFYYQEGPGFQVPYVIQHPQTTLNVQGLWMGGYTPDNSLRLASGANNAYTEVRDFSAGPLDEFGETDSLNCDLWNRIWSVTRYEIENHISDFSDNAIVDNPQFNILSWPGNQNPEFESIMGFELPVNQHGFAPFFDQNNNGVYEPLGGDFPIIKQSQILPEQITWCIFNDKGRKHLVSYGKPICAEIQLTTWAFDCDSLEILDKTVFTSYKIINKSQITLDSFVVGSFTDIDLGCYYDDYYGCSPDNNSFFAYNKNNVDENCWSSSCLNFEPFIENIPVQSVTFLNQSLDFFMYMNSSNCFADPFGGTLPPCCMDQNFYNYLTASWNDGTPLTYGKDGYQSDSTNYTNYAFPGNPNDSSGWSMMNWYFPYYDRYIVGSTNFGKFEPNEALTIDIAYTFHRRDGFSNLENVELMYQQIPQLQSYYNNDFINTCNQSEKCDLDCIWPGDANNDGIANYCDLLAIGVGLDSTGISRSSSIIWAPFSAYNWSNYLPDDTNFKHLDCAGDGTITYHDFFVTIDNYNHTNKNFTLQDDYFIAGEELYFTVLGNTNPNAISPGQEFNIRLKNLDIPNLYGIAFTIEYDTTYFSSIKSFGEDGFDLEQFSFLKSYPQKGEFDFSQIKPTNFSNIPSSPALVFHVEAQSEFTDTLLSASTRVKVKNIKAIDRIGNELDIGSTDQSFTFIDVPVHTSRILNQGFSINTFPNPFSQSITIEFELSESAKMNLAIYDVNGRLVSQLIDNERTNSGISTSIWKNEEVLSGVYFGKLSVNNETRVFRIIKF